MSEHTKEPWSYRKTGQHWNNESLINIEINYGDHEECIADTVYTEADARRIIACVNACAGLDTELLENIVLTGDTLKDRFEALKAEATS